MSHHCRLQGVNRHPTALLSLHMQSQQRMFKITRVCTLLSRGAAARRSSSSLARAALSARGKVADTPSLPVKAYRTQSRIQPKETLAWPDLDLETLHANVGFALCA